MEWIDKDGASLNDYMATGAFSLRGPENLRVCKMASKQTFHQKKNHTIRSATVRAHIIVCKAAFPLQTVNFP
jgi:hypothetical protein